MPSVSENTQKRISSSDEQHTGEHSGFSRNFCSSSNLGEAQNYELVYPGASDIAERRGFERSSPSYPCQLPFAETSDMVDEYLTLEGTSRCNQEALYESKFLKNQNRQNPEETQNRLIPNGELQNNFTYAAQSFHPDTTVLLNDENNFASSALPRVKRRRRRYSISSIPVSTVSVFSAFRAQTQHETKPPKRSTCQLLLNSSIMFGREFCYAVEGGLTTPILLSIGLPLNMYSLVWVLSPVLGFVLQPIMGSLSDRCTCRWGKRRPFILALAVLLLIGLTLFLNGEQFVAIFASSESNRRFSAVSSVTVAAIAVTITGVVLFDFSADFIEGPVRAYAMDVCDEEDIKRSLLFQAVFTGAGGAFGYASGGISWVRDTPLRRFFPSDRQVVFSASAVIFVLSCILNLMSIQENESNHKLQSRNNKQTKKQPKQIKQGFNVQEPRHRNKTPSVHAYDQEDPARQNGADAEAAVLQLLARNNRNRLCEEFESNHLIKIDGDSNIDQLYFNANLRKIYAGKKKKIGYKRKKQLKNLVKKKKKHLYKYNGKTNGNYQNLISNPPATYGTFATEPHQNVSDNGVISVYEPQQLSWPFTVFVDSESKTLNPSKNHLNTSHRETLTSQHDAPNAWMKFFSTKSFDQKRDCDTDSLDSTPTSLGFMLDRYFPYAAVDPAFKYLKAEPKSVDFNTNHLLTNLKPQKKNPPEDAEEESIFSEALTTVSERIKADEEDINDNETSKIVGGLKGLVVSIKTMPKELRFLCICHLLGWIAFLSIALFFTDFVGQVVLKGDPRAPSNSRGKEQYFRGVEMGNWGLTINAAVSCLYCVLLKILIRRLGFRIMYVCGYLAFALGVGCMAIFPTTSVVLALSAVIGILSATLYTIPYMLVAQYHEKYKNLQGTTLERGVGIDCALVTCMIQLAQIITGLGIGAMVNLTGTVTVTIVVASVTACLGAIWAALLALL